MQQISREHDRSLWVCAPKDNYAQEDPVGVHLPESTSCVRECSIVNCSGVDLSSLNCVPGKDSNTDGVPTESDSGSGKATEVILLAVLSGVLGIAVAVLLFDRHAKAQEADGVDDRAYVNFEDREEDQWGADVGR